MLRVMVAMLLALVAGCKSNESPEPSPAPPPVGDRMSDAAAPPIPEGATGIIRGRVMLRGPAPAAAPIKSDSDPVCARAGIADESVVLGVGGGVRDAVVRLAPGSYRSEAPADPIVIVQDGCMYRPRVQGAVEGQTIEVRNADATVHNVHGYDRRTGGERRALYNEVQVAGAPAIVKPTAGQAVVELTCDIHPWMRGYVVVTPHRLFTVTGPDGRFELAGVPPGTHVVEAWHPVLGALSAEVQVAAGEPTERELSFGD